MIQKTINYLGLRATDRVTGLKGVVTSVCFDLYGCVQVAIDPPANLEKGETAPGRWFDVNRVELDMESDRVMPVPDFDARADDPADYGQGAADHSDRI